MDEELFGRYKLLGLIGKGGMGQVYRAHDTTIGRDVAIKVLPSDLVDQPGYRARFQREAYTVARLNEPHIIPIYDTGEIDGRLYLVMPIVDGVDLQTLLKSDGAMRPELAVKVIEQVASALDTAHAHGLVHRDIKPSNVLLMPSEFVYLIDFGIARDESSDTRLTQTGSVIGTLAYMAPERFTTGHADGRSDVYALACVLHECLTGDAPYPGNSIEQQMAGHLISDPPRPTSLNPDIPATFDPVIARGMAKDPEARYQSASELAAAARSALAGAATVAASPPIPEPPTIAAPPTSRQGPPPSFTHPAPGPVEDPRTAVLPRHATPPPQPVITPPPQPIRRDLAPPPAARDSAPQPAVRDAPPRPAKRASPAIPFAIAAVVVALVGLGAPAIGGDLPPGTVTVSGIDPVGAGEITADLSKPIPIVVTAPGADSASLALDILGTSVGGRAVPLTPDPAGGTAMLSSPVNRYVLAGALPAEITVMRGPTPVGTYRFTLSSTQSALTTVTAVGTLILILIAAAYLESNIWVLRQGRRESPASVLAALLFAAALGVAAVAAAWVLFGSPPTIATLTISAGLGALAGLAAALGARRVGAARRPGQSRR